MIRLLVRAIRDVNWSFSIKPFGEAVDQPFHSKTIEQAQERGLAGAARSDDRQHLPGEHLDRHVIDDTRASDLPAEVVSLDDGRWRRKMLLPAWGAYSNS